MRPRRSTFKTETTSLVVIDKLQHVIIAWLCQVFCSCSVDKSLRIWDVRSPPSSACKITIDNSHDSDVNVISWNCKEQHFIASGGDDGVIKVWDLRQYKVTQWTVQYVELQTRLLLCLMSCSPTFEDSHVRLSVIIRPIYFLSDREDSQAQFSLLLKMVETLVDAFLSVCGGKYLVN